MDVVGVVRRLAQYGRDGLVDAGLDYLLAEVVEARMAGRFEYIDRLLVSVDYATMDSDLAVGLLLYTGPCRDKLPSRKLCVARWAVAERKRGGGEIDDTLRILLWGEVDGGDVGA